MNYRHLIGTVALGVLVAGCGGQTGNQTAETVAGVPTTFGTANGATTTTLATATTNVAPTTTTTTVATTTTTQLDPAEAFAVHIEFEDAKGWRYQVLVAYAMQDPNPSAGGCIESAPPGQTNVLFLVAVKNLQTDRPAPTPLLVFTSNLGDAGEPIPTTNPFDDELGGSTLGKMEVSPNADGTRCRLASALFSEVGSIDAATSNPHWLTIGPIDPDRISELVLGLRLIEKPGSWVEVVFTPEAGSGTVTDNTGEPLGG